jgi:hypothetical protein
MFLVRARRDIGVFLGLKPQAQSYHPFGIKSDTSSRDRVMVAWQFTARDTARKRSVP